MNTEKMINSIYNSKKKSKDEVIFPKIFKPQITPPQNKVFVRGVSRKYNQHNIFKIQDQKKQKKLKQQREKECRQLQDKIVQLNKNHEEWITQIDQKQKRIMMEIESNKKNQYQIKLNIWELKNQIMDLNSMLLEEQAEFKRLQDLAIEEGEYQQGEDFDELNEGIYVQGDLGEGQQNDLNESSSINVLHSLSQQDINIDSSST